MAGDQVLTQADIDALLSGKPAAAPPPPPPPPPAPPAAAAPAAAPVAAAPPPAPVMAPAPAVSDALRGTVDQLGARLRSLEDAVNRLSQQPPGFGADAGVSEAVVQQLQQQLQTLNATVNAILAAMQNTVGFRAHDTFICSDCQTQGFVAARLNCTACGKDNWWGWWPPPQ